MTTRRQFLQSILLAGLAPNALASAVPARKALPVDGLYPAPEAVGRVTGNSAEVNLVSGTTRECLIEWGRSPDFLTCQTSVRGVGSLTGTLHDLLPGTRYYYRVGTRDTDKEAFRQGEVRSFVTRRPPGSSFSFAVLADSHLVGKQELVRYYDNIVQTAEMVAREDIDFVVFVGDEACLDGSGAYFQVFRLVQNQDDAFQRYALWRNAYARLLCEKPAFLALGNHDGEAGFYAEEVRNGGRFYWQRWGTIARKRYILNPRPDTYPEGGENEGRRGDDGDPASGGAEEGNCSPLENYFAWSWGDALFVVLDPFRYTGPGRPSTPDQWTIGPKQMEWLERTLKASAQKHKFVVAHHLVGGSPWNAEMNAPGAYGRGGAEYAHLGEQKRIHELMQAHNVRFFLYGHDHIFRLSERDGINYVCCGRPGKLSSKWWGERGWREVYGGDFIGLIGYTLVRVSPDAVDITYKVSGASSTGNTRWGGKLYSLEDGMVISVETPVERVVKVWSPADPLRANLFNNGSVSGRTIKLGRKLRGPIDSVNVIYVGQEAYQKTLYF